MATQRNEVFARQPILGAMFEAGTKAGSRFYPVFLRYS
jgi:hypothetical protein